MIKRIIAIAAMLVMVAGIAFAEPSNYRVDGRWVIGGSLDVVSGGDLDIESGGALKIGGTAITSTAAELNALDGITSTYTELNLLDGSTAGTTVASKAVVVDANKATDVLGLSAGAATAAVAARFGASATEGMEVKVIDETVTLSGAVAAIDITQDVPTGAVILSVQANLETAVGATTAVKVGIGVSADPNKYGLTSGLTQNLKVDTVPDWAVLSGAEDIQVFAADTAGDAAGTIDSGSVRVRIVFIELNSLDDAS